MHSDKLNEVGKALKKTRQETDHVIRRVGEHFPKIERVRDIVRAESDGITEIPFEMYFKTKRDDNRVSLDLVFLLPICGCGEQPTEV